MIQFVETKNTGCPNINALLAHLLVSDLGRGVLRGKNNSKKFGNKKNIEKIINNINNK